jgi:putative transposase
MRKDQPLLQQIQALSHQHPRYGYRRIHALLCRASASASASAINIKRVHRLWKQMARQVPPRKKRRTHLKNRAPRTPQQALYPGHVWSYDFVHDKCRGGAKLKLLCLSDEFTRQCHAIEVGTCLTAKDVQSVLGRLFDTANCATSALTANFSTTESRRAASSKTSDWPSTAKDPIPASATKLPMSSPKAGT